MFVFCMVGEYNPSKSDFKKQNCILLLLPVNGGEARPTFRVTGGVLTTSGIGFKLAFTSETLGLELGLAASDLSL